MSLQTIYIQKSSLDDAQAEQSTVHTSTFEKELFRDTKCQTTTSGNYLDKSVSNNLKRKHPSNNISLAVPTFSNDFASTSLCVPTSLKDSALTNGETSTENRNIGDTMLNPREQFEIDLASPEQGQDALDEADQHIQDTYATKKAIAQGMMDIALITANSNQLRYLLEYGRHSMTFHFIMILIITSLCIQITVGITLILRNKLDNPLVKRPAKATFVDNLIVIGVFMVTIINVLIAAFTTTMDKHIFEKPHT